MSDDKRRTTEHLKRLLREIGTRPEGPAALGFQAAMDRMVAPRRAAKDALVQAMAERLEKPSTEADLAVAAARSRIEIATEQILTPDIEADLAEEAVRLIEHRRHRPPSPDEILDPGSPPLPHDPQIAFGLLGGSQGTFHRLWAMLVTQATFGGPGDDEEDDVLVMRAEFESLLGRGLTVTEWGRLTAHAERHARDVVRPAMADCKRG